MEPDDGLEQVSPEGRGDVRKGTVPSPAAAVLLVIAAAVLFVVGGLPLQILFGEVGLLLAQILFLLVPALLLVRAGRFDPIRVLRPRMPAPAEVGAGVLLMAGGVGVAWFLAWAQSFVLPVPTEYMETLERVLTAETLGRYLWLLLLVAVVPAMCEEVLFRGAVLSGFRSRLPDAWAVVLTGLVFGIFHLSPETAFRILPAAWLGILLGWVVVASGSLPLAVILHFLNNAAILTLIAIPATREALTMAEQRPPLILLPAALVLLAVGARLLAGGRHPARAGPGSRDPHAGPRQSRPDDGRGPEVGGGPGGSGETGAGP